MLDTPLLALIIPFKNEAECMHVLMTSLLQQSLNRQLWEVILVDDHSHDSGKELAMKYLQGTDLRWSILTNSGRGKKSALLTGIRYSKADLLATTDADCWLSPHWLQHLYTFLQDPNHQMLVGLVQLMPHKGWLAGYQHWEWAVYRWFIKTSASLAFPITCFGANLAFRKSAFESVQGYHTHRMLKSGDDELLLHDIVRKYPNGVRLLTEQDSIVYTHHVPGWKSMIMQRLRWMSKWRYYKFIELQLFYFLVWLLCLGVCVYLTQLVQKEPALLLMGMAWTLISLWEPTHYDQNKFNWIYKFRSLAYMLLLPFIFAATGLAAQLQWYKWK